MIKEEIKSFLANRRISQAVVAQVTGEYGLTVICILTPPPPHKSNIDIQILLFIHGAGISQSRISHWLLQQGSDLSEQKKRAFFRWYQLEKTNPGNAALLPRFSLVI